MDFLLFNDSTINYRHLNDNNEFNLTKKIVTTYIVLFAVATTFVAIGLQPHFISFAFAIFGPVWTLARDYIATFWKKVGEDSVFT